MSLRSRTKKKPGDDLPGSVDGRQLDEDEHGDDPADDDENDD